MLFSERTLNTKRRLAEFKRKLGGRAHVVEVFLQIDDPYSYLLAHYLPVLEELLQHQARSCICRKRSAMVISRRPTCWLNTQSRTANDLHGELGVPFLDKGAVATDGAPRSAD